MVTYNNNIIFRLMYPSYPGAYFFIGTLLPHCNKAKGPNAPTAGKSRGYSKMAMESQKTGKEVLHINKS